MSDWTDDIKARLESRIYGEVVWSQGDNINNCAFLQDFLEPYHTDIRNLLAEREVLRDALTHYSLLPYGGDAEAKIALAWRPEE